MDRPDSDAIDHMRRALRGLSGIAPNPIARDLQLRFEAALKVSYKESVEAHLIAEDVIGNMALSGRTLTPQGP